MYSSVIGFCGSTSMKNSAVFREGSNLTFPDAIVPALLSGTGACILNDYPAKNAGFYLSIPSLFISL